MPAAGSEPLSFEQAGRVPSPGDNVAIAVRTLPAGTRILLRQLVFEFTQTILEGHRFAIFRIRKGEPLLSWGLPFGLALRDIEPGEYICNEKILRVLADRYVPFELPRSPNFIDYRLPFQLDEAKFRPGIQVSVDDVTATFEGFRRTPERGAGTRNFVVVLGVTSRAAGFAPALARRFERIRTDFPNIDGVVAISHTEGGAASRPNNLELTLRTLAGFMVNPNVGAVLCVDFDNGAVSNQALQHFLTERQYPLEGLTHEFFSVRSSFEKALGEAERIVRDWLPRVNKTVREVLPAAYLRLGLQCGGSDAFSGVSGNPLVGLMSRDVVACGGTANLAETDELIGAESYVLSNVRDLETAKAFLARSERFQQWAALHGHTAEGNPSGGNMYRGLYNITIKSIGAARKKDPATRLDYVIDFGELMPRAGFYFMDSPGNDLESIAGQVASGCNMILFATGNGSITNFPFVPTIKIMTTSARFELVRQEMDLNAGRYLDGEPLDKLGEEAFAYLLRIASGEPSAGEKAGHSQVQLWREWRGGGHIKREMTPSEVPLEGALDRAKVRDAISKPVSGEAALVLPTSLCSGQIAQMIVSVLERDPGKRFQRAVALPHTEGCGNSGGEPERLFMRTMAGYLGHPLVGRALLLEHGCEKTHNDAFRNLLKELNLPEAKFGFASVQLDGGIERVTRKAVKWFEAAELEPAPPSPFSLGLAGIDLPPNVLGAFHLLAQALQAEGATAIICEQLSAFPDRLAYGERCPRQGVFTMECPTDDLVEILTGLGATGAELLIAFDDKTLVPGNPLVPTVQIATDRLPRHLHPDVDILVAESASAEEIADALLERIAEIRTGRRAPRSRALGNIAFQITRGETGISL